MKVLTFKDQRALSLLDGGVFHYYDAAHVLLLADLYHARRLDRRGGTYPLLRFPSVLLCGKHGAPSLQLPLGAGVQVRFSIAALGATREVAHFPKGLPRS